MAAELEKRLNEAGKWQWRLRCLDCPKDGLWSTEKAYAERCIALHNSAWHPMRTYQYNDYDTALGAFELALAEAAADSGMEPDQIAYDIMESISYDTEPSVYRELRRTQL